MSKPAKKWRIVLEVIDIPDDGEPYFDKDQLINECVRYGYAGTDFEIISTEEVPL